MVFLDRSPVPCSASIDDLAGDLNALARAEGLTLGGRKFQCLLYVAGTLLISRSWTDLKKLLGLCEVLEEILEHFLDQVFSNSEISNEYF